MDEKLQKIFYNENNKHFWSSTPTSLIAMKSNYN